MADGHPITDGEVPWQAILGFVNFSEGRPDPRFQKQINDACRFLAQRPSGSVVAALEEFLRDRLRSLHAAGTSAFKDIAQADAVITNVFRRVLPTYREHHADLLGHQSEADLFQPFFIARVFESVLAQLGPWDEHDRIAAGALHKLNDYVGYRPIAVLETRPRGEPYDHERLRPIPLYLRSAGVAFGRYHEIVTGCLETLRNTDPAILAEAQFDLAMMDELALDPRAYDHGHPANRRPNQVFGEWDPHCIDNKGYYRRFVIRQLLIDLLLKRVEEGEEHPHSELMWEASSVLAGVMLMGAGTTGAGPTAYDSSLSFSLLVPKIAAYRDAFYRHLLDRLSGPHRDRLKAEAAHMKQPFAGARRHLNLSIAQHRAAQLQQQHLAILLAEMGHPGPSREQAARIPTPSIRIQSEILLRVTLGNLHTERGELAQAAALLPEAEDLLHRGIGCGALVDPWNILGFQGLYPLSMAREDSVRDHRVDELVYLVERQLDLYARVMAEAAAAQQPELAEKLRLGMRRLAQWWDPFASITVNDVRRLHAAEAVEAAEHVAAALALWRQQGAETAGPAFWKKHLRQFNSPKAFAQVVEALLEKDDSNAAMALLMSWLSQAELVPLEDGHHSFHVLARRWLLGVIRAEGKPGFDFDLVKQFFDYLESNAGEYGDVPNLGLTGPDEEDEQEDIYSAAYENFTYKDSTADGNEGDVMDDRPADLEFPLEEELPRLEKHLRFLASLAQLWQIAARHYGLKPAGAARTTFAGWLTRARANRQKLIALLDAAQQCPIPEPLGSFESIMEYRRRRGIKERLLDGGISTCLETVLAVWALRVAESRAGHTPLPGKDEPEWLPALLRLEREMGDGDAEQARTTLAQLLPLFRSEPLLFVPLSGDGHPREILRARIAQAVLRLLLPNLPRLGLLRETYDLLRTVREMEQNQPTTPGTGRRVTEFDRLFRLAFIGVIESVMESVPSWNEEERADRPLVELLRAVSRPFYRLWIEHSNGLHLASMERITSDEQLVPIREFIQKYGRDLFHAKFMTHDHLRGILDRGVTTYLDYLRDNPNPKEPIKLIDDLAAETPPEKSGWPLDLTDRRDHVARYLEFILHVVLENYEEFKDYNATTAQAAYGENLHVLFDFLRVKAGYERYHWQQRPLVLVHEVLARQGRDVAAELWESAFRQSAAPTAEKLQAQIAALELQHGLILRTIRDRLNEKFVKPLAIDRLCVRVAPAMEEARQAITAGPALGRFLGELQVQAATPTGSGLDVPDWLERLQQEARRVRAERISNGGATRESFLAPRKMMALEEIRRQLEAWEKDAKDKKDKPEQA